LCVEAGLLEKPLPKPGKDVVGYACARVLESILESHLALEFLYRGYTRNAAGKVFQAWRALLAALLALERDRLMEVLRSDEERKWLERVGIPRVPTGKLKRLSQLLEKVGYRDVVHYTNTALSLHDYQYHGPDPDMAMSKYACREEAVVDAKALVGVIVRLVESYVKPSLERRRAWTERHEKELDALKERLGKLYS